jgi:hypothetical protein
VSFILSAGKVLLSQIVAETNSIEVIEVLFQSINIFCLGGLALCVVLMRPCLINWFNSVEFLVVWIGFVWNIFGLVLYIKKAWVICLVGSVGVSVGSIGLGIFFIKKRFFGEGKVLD